MITIRSGKIIIPEEERFVGFAGDDRSNSKQFLLEDFDGGGCTFTLYLKFDDGRVTSAVLTAESSGEDTVLTWNIMSEHILKSGIIMAQLKIADSDGVVFHTGSDFFIAAASAERGDDGEEIDMLSRSEFETRMSEAVSLARATAPYIGDDGYWYVYDPEVGEYARSYSARVEIDDSVSDLSENPVQNKIVKAYIDAVKSSKVDKTREIAGIPLSGDISASALVTGLMPLINPNSVVANVSSAFAGQFGKTSDDTPVFSDHTGGWVTLAKSSQLPTKTSDLANDSGFLTSHQDVSGKENVSNKVSSVHNSTSTTDYPCVAAMTGYVANAISGKANSATTLSGYGISDAYTKTEINSMIGDIETLLQGV